MVGKGGRPSGPKTRNNSTWTEARFKSFIMSSLRRTSMRSWGPISQALKNARVDRGEYKCQSCGNIVPTSVKDENGRRVKNIHVDHIVPVIDPEKGFVSWDDVVKRLFSETDNLAAICTDCHKIKTDIEKAVAKARRERLKEIEDID